MTQPEKPSPKLPDLLSDLILLAIKDLEACEQDPRVEIDMDAWLSPRRGHAPISCSVCLAGAVLVRAVDADLTDVTEFNPLRVDSWYGVDERFRQKMYALDDVRLGLVDLALAYFDVPAGKGEEIQNWVDATWSGQFPPYEDDAYLFKQALREVVQKLKQEGL